MRRNLLVRFAVIRRDPPELLVRELLRYSSHLGYQRVDVRRPVYMRHPRRRVLPSGQQVIDQSYSWGLCLAMLLPNAMAVSQGSVLDREVLQRIVRSIDDTSLHLIHGFAKGLRVQLMIARSSDHPQYTVIYDATLHAPCIHALDRRPHARHEAYSMARPSHQRHAQRQSHSAIGV